MLIIYEPSLIDQHVYGRGCYLAHFRADLVGYAGTHHHPKCISHWHAHLPIPYKECHKRKGGTIVHRDIKPANVFLDSAGMGVVHLEGVITVVLYYYCTIPLSSTTRTRNSHACAQGM